MTKTFVTIETPSIGKGKNKKIYIVIRRVKEGDYYRNGKKWAKSPFGATEFSSRFVAERKIKEKGYILQQTELDAEFPGWQTDDNMAAALARRNSTLAQ